MLTIANNFTVQIASGLHWLLAMLALKPPTNVPSGIVLGTERQTDADRPTVTLPANEIFLSANERS